MSNFATYPSLKDRSVFISGGSTGIGAALVQAFAGQGSKVAFCDIDVAGAERTVQAVKQAGHQAPTFLECDLRDIDRLRETIAAAGKANGPITVLVNNAARDDRHAMETVTPEYWDERMAVTLKHPLFAAHAVFPMIKEAGRG